MSSMPVGNSGSINPQSNLTPPVSPSQLSGNDATKVSQSQSLQVNDAASYETLANSLFMSDNVAGQTGVQGTSQTQYAKYMDLPPAKLPSDSQASASIKLTELTQQLSKEVSQTGSEMLKSMNGISDSNLKAAVQKAQQNAENATEQAKKQHKKRIFGWIGKALEVVVGAALIATGVGAGLGAFMIASVAVGALEQIPAVSNFMNNHEWAKAAITVGMTVGAVCTGGVVFGIGTAVSQTMSQFGPEIAQGLENAGWNSKQIEAFMITMSVAGAVTSAVGGFSAASSASNAAEVSQTAAKVARTTSGVAGLGMAATSITSGAYSIQIGNLQKEFGENQAAIQLLNTQSQRIIEMCSKNAQGMSQDMTELSKSIVETCSRIQEQSSDARMNVATRV